MSDFELKPCPFCAGNARLFHGIDYESVECCNCGAKISIHDVGKEAQYDAIDQWNNRPLERLLEERIEEYKDALGVLVKTLQNYERLYKWLSSNEFTKDVLIAETQGF